MKAAGKLARLDGSHTPVSEILFRKYRDYVANRIEVNNAMMALLAGSRLAAHTLSLTAGSTTTLAQVFPAVEHIERFNLRSDSARQLLADADQHIASVAIPYALATHEEFVLDMLEFLKAESRSLMTHGKQIKAWNMHSVLFETCGYAEPAEWMETFHVLREVRNSIIHAGGLLTLVSPMRSPRWVQRRAQDGRSSTSAPNPRP